MNEWGFIGQDILVTLGKSATINKFKLRRGYVRAERLMLPIAIGTNPHSSYLVTHHDLERMNKAKLIFIGLLIAYSIYLIITLVTSDISGMIETLFGIKQVVIMFPIVVIFVALMWAWIFPKFSRRLKDPNYPVPFPNMRNKLSESPLEWIYMLAFFFIIPSIALELSTLVGHGTFYGIGFLGIAYGLGLIGSIYLIRRKKANGV